MTDTNPSPSETEPIVPAVDPEVPAEPEIPVEPEPEPEPEPVPSPVPPQPKIEQPVTRTPEVKSKSLMVMYDNDSTPVSNELKTMVPSRSAPAEPQPNPLNKLLLFATAGLGAVVVCLSIAVAYDASNVKTEIVKVETTQEVQIIKDGFPTANPPPGDNYCAGTKVDLPNIDCLVQQIDDTFVVDPSSFALGTAEQAGANVTKGYVGDLEVTTVPITGPYFKEGLCPVNVHWHLGTEHLSVGEYDEDGKGPKGKKGSGYNRNLAGEARAGFQCHYYDETDEKYTKEYDWKHCVDTHVGETYEIHWPHSNMGACGTVNQFQTPFYDGVFCNFATDFGGSLADAKIGVQGQVFTIVNDEAYYYPDLMRGMIVDGEFGKDIATYTGSTTGTSRSNSVCSQYTGITWQVDRKCHLISASSFDKMCADMKAQRDDMKDDLYPHGSRELVADHLVANNQQNRLLRKVEN